MSSGKSPIAEPAQIFAERLNPVAALIALKSATDESGVQRARIVDGRRQPSRG